VQVLLSSPVAPETKACRMAWAGGAWTQAANRIPKMPGSARVFMTHLPGSGARRGRKPSQANDVQEALFSGSLHCSSRAVMGLDRTNERYRASRFATLFDHLVGEREQRVGNAQAERPGGGKVEDQLEFRRLGHRQVGRFLALEDSGRIGAG